MQSRKRKPTVGLVSYSAIADDPRVRRQGDAIIDAGWTAIGFGHQGARSPRPDWNVVEIRGDNAPAQGALTVRRARVLANLLATMTSGRIEPWLRSLFPLLPSFMAAARQHPCDLWIANDWPVLQLVQQLAAEQSVPFHYDTHELATDEYGQSRRWKLTRLPLIRRVEGQGIRAAASVSCVCDGIGRELARTYSLGNQPIVIRNVPEFVQSPPAPPSDRIRVLYHGIVAPGRGLEEAIASVHLWKPEFHLTVRGPGDAHYRKRLLSLIGSHRLADRVVLAEPVPMTHLVREAAQFDVGFFALPGNSLHNLYVLPNKLFEYIMAGLAICVSDLPEMAAVVQRYKLGVLMPSLTEHSIAASINALDHDQITAYKSNARSASKTLNWGEERRKPIACCEAALYRGVPQKQAT